MPRKPKPHFNKKRGRWYSCIGEIGADGKRSEVYAPAEVCDEAAAWDWLRAERARRAAEVVALGPHEPTVEWVCEAYMGWCETRRNEGRLSPEHYGNKGFHLGLFAEALGGRVVRTLSPGDMNEFIGLLQSRYSPNYVSNIVSSANAALNWAVKSGHLATNPVKGHESPTVPRSPERFAERAEAAAFLRFWRTRTARTSVSGRYERMTLLLQRCLIRTGARPGELCRLRWHDLKWDGGTTSTGHAFARAVLPATRHKTGHLTGKPRTIYFSPTLTRSLRRLESRPDRHPSSVFVHGRGRGGKGAGEPWESGSRLSQAVLRVRREAIAKGQRLASEGKPTRGLDLIRDAGPNRLVNYRWRHTAISTLLMMGIDVPTVAELVGTSPEMVYRIYGHLLDSHLQAAAEQLARGRK